MFWNIFFYAVIAVGALLFSGCCTIALTGPGSGKV